MSKYIILGSTTLCKLKSENFFSLRKNNRVKVITQYYTIITDFQRLSQLLILQLVANIIILVANYVIKIPIY
jgi:hypothetical protein